MSDETKVDPLRAEAARALPDDGHEGLADVLYRRANELDPAPAAPEVDLGEVPALLDAFARVLDDAWSDEAPAQAARERVLSAMRALVAPGRDLAGLVLAARAKLRRLHRIRLWVFTALYFVVGWVMGLSVGWRLWGRS